MTTTAAVAAPVTTHPLHPLRADEVALACELAKAADTMPAGVRIAYCTLEEPAKDALLRFDAGTAAAPDRQALVVAYDRAGNRTIEAVVSLSERRALDVVVVAGAQAPIMTEEFLADAEAVRADPIWQAAVRARGVTDMATVVIEAWMPGHYGVDIDATGRRIARAVAYVSEGAGDNHYARPLENLVALVDRNSHEVIEVHDGDVVPVPSASARFDADSVGPQREVAPLDITQPDGPGFVLDGYGLSWQNWKLRVSLHPIEGLVLHSVGYEDGGRLRSILHRASVSEMVVPYGSTAMNHWWKNAFDAGDVGLGKTANSLTLGCDCLGEIRYLDGVLADEDGGAQVVAQAICIHEEDYGILWKHQDLLAGVSEVRRSRRLVISSISTVGNYEYGFFWYLYQDGTIAAEVKLTGIVQTQAVAPGQTADFANLVTPELAAPHHQHLFSYRLDVDLDGQGNTVVEVDAEAEPPGPDNPWGNAFRPRSTTIASESVGGRIAAPEKARYWKVENASVRNGVGAPVAYKLVPGTAGTMLAAPEAAITSRAGFATKNLWVTAYAPDERRAAGNYPNQHAGGDGLPRWTAADRPLTDTDVVLWHTVTTTHFARPEDWPVMPADCVGFTLKPVGFFDRNPALDVPPSTSGHCHR